MNPQSRDASGAWPTFFALGFEGAPCSVFELGTLVSYSGTRLFQSTGSIPITL
jgi:hypothetical protein